ncbi:hypothetical protein ACFY4C_40810 [Actinomadura viridis]
MTVGELEQFFRLDAAARAVLARIVCDRLDLDDAAWAALSS